MNASVKPVWYFAEYGIEDKDLGDPTLNLTLPRKLYISFWASHFKLPYRLIVVTVEMKRRMMSASLGERKGETEGI